MEDIQQGTLDFVLTKPADGELLVSLRRVQLLQGVDIVVGGVLIVIATVRLPGTVPRPRGRLRAGADAGIVAIYCFWLLLSTVAFWVTRLDPIVQAARRHAPGGTVAGVDLPRLARVGLTILVPLAFASPCPVRPRRARLRLAGARLDRLHRGPGRVTRVVWRLALRRYSGASS